MPVRSLRDGTIKVRVDDDGSGSAAEVTVDLEDGDLEYTERRPVNIVLDRGRLDHARKAADETLELSFSFMLQRFQEPGADNPTVYEALKHIGDASAWVSQESDSDTWAVDIEFSIADPAGGAAEVLSFDRLHPTEVSMQEGETADVISVTGTAPRRTPFPAPGDIPGAAFGYAAHQITGLADEAAVASWEDLAGFGPDLAQATGAKRPTYQTNEINGLPIVRFDGTDDIIAAALASVISQPFTLFLIAKHTSGAVAADEAFVAGEDDQGNPSGQILANQDTTDDHVADAGAALAFGALSSGYRIFVVAFDGASSVVRLDRSQSTGNAGARNLASIAIGALFGETLHGDVDVAEFWGYGRKLTTAQMRMLEDYAEWMYGL